MAIRAVIFDFGGVIVRTEDWSGRQHLAERLGRDPKEIYRLVFDSETAAQATLGKISVDQHKDAVCKGLGIPVTEQDAFWADFWGNDQVDFSLVDDLRRMRGRYKTALLSNAWSDLRQVLDERFNILDAFDELVISAEIGIAKPDPRIFDYTLQRLGVDSHEAVFVDDFKENIEAARQAGLAVVWFQDPAQARNDLEQILYGNP